MKIGPSFGSELKRAGLVGLPFAWGDDGQISGRENLTLEQNRELQKVIDRHDSTKGDSLVLAQDLLSKFSTKDIELIQAAIAGNADFALLWYSLLAQRDPMHADSARFRAGWRALTQILGSSRVAEISYALGIST